MTTGHNGNGGSGGCIDIMQDENCRFAYTINNAQPVRCSIIGDQPLFFMDFEGSVEDECAEDADPFGIGAIEKGVAALKEQILGTDRTLEFSEDAANRLADFIEESISLFQPVEKPRGNYAFRLAALKKTLGSSRLSAAFLEEADKHGITFAFSAQVEHVTYDREAKTVFFNPVRDDTDLILLAVRELRRVWQHKHGALLHPLTFHPDQAILINRAQRADLAVAVIRTAWELQLSGIKEPWERLENSSMADLTRAFAREAYLDFRTLNNGLAACAVFESWFLSDRCRHEDRQLIQHMLSDYQGYVFDTEQASRSVSADLLIALGSVPFGKNYLSGFVQTIMGDPLFAEVRDRSNANFLWFIKFERSFREAEQDLQTPSTIQGHGDHRESSITKKDLDGDNAQTSTVIALPGMASRPARENGRPLHAPASDGLANAGTGNVLYLDRSAHQSGQR